MIRKLFREQSGAVLVQVAMMSTVLLSLAALATDVGNLCRQRRQMQNAADAGALAGARSMCLGNNNGAIRGQANLFATANGASGVTVSVKGNRVTVKTSMVVDTSFAQILGIDSFPASAEAEAACGKAKSACNLMPLAIDFNTWTGHGFGCGQVVYIWDDENRELDCSVYDCDFDDDGKADTAGTGTRGWLDFHTPPYEALDPCDAPGSGSEELRCRVIEGSGWVDLRPPPEGSCAPSADGVRESARHSAIVERILRTGTVNVVIHQGSCATGDYRIVDVGTVTLLEIETHDLDDLAYPGLDSKRLKNVKVIKARVECPTKYMECAGTTGEVAAPGELRGVSLVR